MKVQRETQWLIIGGVFGAALGTLAVWGYLRWGRELLAKQQKAEGRPAAGRKAQARDILDLVMLVLRLIRRVVQLIRPI